MREYLFIGQMRSELAKRKGFRWPDEVLCARKLFRTLRAIHIDPKEQVFANLWDDNGELDYTTVDLIHALNLVVVAMGRTVQAELDKLNVQYIAIYHPAARGPLMKKGAYEKSVRQKLMKPTQ